MFALMRMAMGLGALAMCFGVGYIVAPKGGNDLTSDDFCAAVEASQAIVDTGLPLVSDLQDWVDAAEGLLDSVDFMGDAPEEARSGLSGLLDKVESVAGSAVSGTIDVVTAPLQSLIDMAQVVLVAVQKVITAAQNVISSVGSAACS